MVLFLLVLFSVIFLSLYSISSIFYLCYISTFCFPKYTALNLLLIPCLMSELSFSFVLEIWFGVAVLMVWVLFTVLFPFQFLIILCQQLCPSSPYSKLRTIFIVNTLRIIKSRDNSYFHHFIIVPGVRSRWKSNCKVHIPCFIEGEAMPVSLPLEASSHVEFLSVNTSQAELSFIRIKISLKERKKKEKKLDDFCLLIIYLEFYDFWYSGSSTLISCYFYIPIIFSEEKEGNKSTRQNTWSKQQIFLVVLTERGTLLASTG